MAKKLFSINPQIGKVKYSINTYDGKSTHKDGSEFIGIDTAKNKKEFAALIKKYKADGYKEVDSVFNALNEIAIRKEKLKNVILKIVKEELDKASEGYIFEARKKNDTR